MRREKNEVDQPILEYIHQPVTGFPSPAMDHLQPRIDLNKEFVQHPISTFMIECLGNSMINAFIPPKARLLIDRSITAQNGDIILAVLDGEFIVRRLVKNKFKCFLRPENSKYREIEISNDRDFTIWGVVTHVITNLKDMR